ncbi:MAG TPA: tRNA preQ1(34) S-adenosylmethionine ribosyltransferase-isomerase QueA [Gemmatimonadales bacterium]|nr:tRNA preQ1(34) S-adenosylmethionine ribosyltransferase-isomerase QueA [Gemmatimonadales bacterium]
MAERRWRTSDFDYHLPDDLIAQTPSPTRGASRLLVLDRATGACTDREFASLLDLIPPGDLLVLNSTRVRHARFVGTRDGGGKAEILLLHPIDGERWLAMGRPGRALRVGRVVHLGDAAGLEILAVREDGFREVRFVGGEAGDLIDRFGQLPLPPYITREPDASDDDRYQTVFAERVGSVAAPTAGLHFTETLLGRLRQRGVTIASLDLEVGPGTFRPIEHDDPTEHPMHEERYEIPETLARAVQDARQRSAGIWAVGTTVVRALESAADPAGGIQPGRAATRLMIVPGHTFRVVDHLITNFHLPRSTLLMLVAALAGHERTMQAYQHAVAARYRFYSYGDAMCII